MSTLNFNIARAAWMPADNGPKLSKGKWHKWMNEAFTFMVRLVRGF